jgi:hypothetical protein
MTAPTFPRQALPGLPLTERNMVHLLAALDAVGVTLPASLHSARTTHARLWSALMQARVDAARPSGQMYNPNPGTYQPPGEFTLVLQARAEAAETMRAAVTAGADEVLGRFEDASNRIAAARDRAQRAIDIESALTEALKIVGEDGTLSDAVRAVEDTLYRLLDGRLHAVLKRVSGVADDLPPGTANAAAAYDAGTDAQKAFRLLRDDLLPMHNRIRAAQLKLATDLANGPEWVHPAVRTAAAHVRDVDTVWPGWAGPTHVPLAGDLVSDRPYEVTPPWSTDPIERLLWDARTRVAWVPTMPELQKAYAQATAAREARAAAAIRQTPGDADRIEAVLTPLPNPFDTFEYDADGSLVQM